MALREPNGCFTEEREDAGMTPVQDYRSRQVRDLRDAVNEYIRAHAKGHDVMLAAVMSRLEALEAKMVDNTPKGGYNLKSEGTK